MDDISFAKTDARVGEGLQCRSMGYTTNYRQHLNSWFALDI